MTPVIGLILFFVVMVSIGPLKNACMLLMLAAVAIILIRSYTADSYESAPSPQPAVTPEVDDEEGDSRDAVAENLVLDNTTTIMSLLQNPTDKPTQDGDSQLMDKMQQVSKIDKEAVLNRVRFTSDNFKQYFAEELDERENLPWWEIDVMDGQPAFKDDVSW